MDPAAARSLRQSRIIHAAMVGSLVVYALVVHVLHGTLGWAGTGAPEASRLLRWLFHGLGAVELVTVLAGRARCLSSEAMVAIARRESSGAALARLQTWTILLLALSESIAIYGLVLFLLTGRLADFYPLWTAGLLGQLAVSPRREAWEDVGRIGPRPRG